VDTLLASPHLSPDRGQQFIERLRARPEFAHIPVPALYHSLEEGTQTAGSGFTKCAQRLDRESTLRSLNAVVRSDDGAVSLLVDEIGDVLEVSAESYEPVPENVPQGQRELIRSV
jgi:hypothetical protein